jgi:hypothetical protein
MNLVMPSVESLRATCSRCVSPYGVLGNPPIVAETAAGEFVGGSISLSKPGIVSDGYYHLLSLNRGRTSAIIVQTGGFANLTTMYGPFELSDGCGAVSAPRQLTDPSTRTP